MDGDIRLSPWQRRGVGLIVGKSIYPRVGIAVPPVIGAFLPEPGPIEIRLSNAEQSQRSDTEGKFESKEADEDLGIAPLPWYR